MGGRTCVCLAHSPPGKHCSGDPARAWALHTRYAAGPRAASAHATARVSTADTAAPRLAVSTGEHGWSDLRLPCTFPTRQALQWGPSPCMSPPHMLHCGLTCRIATRSREGEHRRHRRASPRCQHWRAWVVSVGGLQGRDGVARVEGGGRASYLCTGAAGGDVSEGGADFGGTQPGGAGLRAQT